MSEERSRRDLERELEELRRRLRESEEALRAIRQGEVDAVLVEGPEGPRAHALGDAVGPYRILVEEMRDAALILSDDGIVLYSNGRLSNLLGLPRNATVGHEICELAVPDDRETLRSVVERGRDEALIEEIRLRAPGSDAAAETVDVRLAASPLVSDDLHGVCLVVTDLTEVKRRERLEAQERLTRGIVEHAGTAIVVLDTEGRITRMNRLAASLLGEEAEGALLDDLVPLPESLEEMSGRAGVQEVTLEASDGDRAVLLGVRTPGEDLPAESARWIVTLVDITERREAEEQLRFQAQILDTVGEAVIATDLEGRINYWNSGAEEIYGWSAEEVLGRPIFDVTVPPQSRGESEQIMEALLDGRTFTGEFELQRKSGETFTGVVTDSPIYDQTGELVGVVGISRDLTELKTLEQELRQAQKLRAIGQLAGGVAHDFNNILTAIQGHIELLLDACGPDDAMRQDLEEVATNARRAAGLTAQLLAFSRQQMLRPEILDLGQVATEARSLLHRLIGEDIEIEISSPDDLWSVRADRHQIELVLMNLSLNARDAMPGGGHLTVEARNVRLDEGDDTDYADVPPGEYVALVVADTGQGIEPAVLERMYEPFFTTKEKGKGTGLGLSTVHGIVKQSGGHIFAESDAGRGTRFEILLPRAEGVPEDRGSEDRPSAEGGPETILLVEDEDSVRRIARRVLERMGYRILEAAGPEEALERVTDAPDGSIDLLLTDMVMPEMTGAELAERLETLRGGIRVLFMSGYTESEIGRRGIAAAGDAFLQKPFSTDELARKVRDVLDH